MTAVYRWSDRAVLPSPRGHLLQEYLPTDNRQQNRAEQNRSQNCCSPCAIVKCAKLGAKVSTCQTSAVTFLNEPRVRFSSLMPQVDESRLALKLKRSLGTPAVAVAIERGFLGALLN